MWLAFALVSRAVASACENGWRTAGCACTLVCFATALFIFRRRARLDFPDNVHAIKWDADYRVTDSRVAHAPGGCRTTPAPGGLLRMLPDVHDSRRSLPSTVRRRCKCASAPLVLAVSIVNICNCVCIFSVCLYCALCGRVGATCVWSIWRGLPCGRPISCGQFMVVTSKATRQLRPSLTPQVRGPSHLWLLTLRIFALCLGCGRSSSTNLLHAHGVASQHVRCGGGRRQSDTSLGSWYSTPCSKPRSIASCCKEQCSRCTTEAWASQVDCLTFWRCAYVRVGAHTSSRARCWLPLVGDRFDTGVCSHAIRPSWLPSAVCMLRCHVASWTWQTSFRRSLPHKCSAPTEGELLRLLHTWCTVCPGASGDMVVVVVMQTGAG